MSKNLNKKAEIIPVAISQNDYNRNIANLIEHLLSVDAKIFNSQDQEAK